MTNLGYTPEEPIAAIATALAPGALGVIRCSGKNCIELFSKVFSRPKALLEAKGYSIVYGWILNTSSETKQRIDEVLVSVFRAPHSFTGEDSVEISCHGGTSVVTAIQNLLLQNGFRQAERGEFTFRAYINGKTDLTKAEAIREIIDSKTDVSRSRAAGRLAGNLFTEIDSIKKLIIDTVAAIEVEIEYPEDEETIADAFDTTPLYEAKERLEHLVASWTSEKLYQEGARVVLCGKTNAGKSSLFNAMLKEERAIVSDIEGTTRDWLESWVSIDGIPVRLFDTAGLRKTDDVIEAEGVERTKDLSEEADVILYLVDAGTGLTADDTVFIEEQKNIPLVLVWNKCDKSESGLQTEATGEEQNVSLQTAAAGDSKNISLQTKAAGAEQNVSLPTEVRISAKTGSGVGELISIVKKILTGGEQTDREQAGLGSARQKASVTEALERVTHALTAANEDYALDAVVQDLEDCLDSLGEVTGDVTPEDILDSIFSHFCVGK